MDASGPAAALVVVMMLVGLTGIVVPVLPGLALTWAGTLFWALVERTTPAWWALGVATALWLTGLALQWLVPGRRLRRAGVGTSTMLVAAALGLVGFFVIPVVGLPIGFVAGVYLMESVGARRTGDGRSPRELTVHALTAAGLTMVIELLTGLLIVAAWATSLIAPRLL